MTTATRYTALEVAKILDDNDTIDKVNVWLTRGDGIAVYRNEDLGSAMVGHMQFVSFGSNVAAMLQGDEPPQQMPDTSGSINWRYQLAGVYRSGLKIPHLPRPDEVSWATPFEVCERIVDNFKSHTLPTVEWEMRVITQFSLGEETDAKRFVVKLHLRGGVDITLQSWVYDEGINRLDPFYWTIDDRGDFRDGSDPNLGGALVTVYNATLKGG